MFSHLKRIARPIKNSMFVKSLKNLKRSEMFINEFYKNYFYCKWQPHPLYSVFTQYDKEFYLEYFEAFRHKYRCFFAVSKTINSKKIIELGTHAGSSADAYISANPNVEYLGIDLFGEATRNDDGSPWKPYEVATQLFKDRNFTNYELLRIDLRTLDKLPSSSDLVVVDAAHDFENEYADLRLALTAAPEFIFIDDVDGEEAGLATQKFLREDLKGRAEYIVRIDYIGGGLVIKLKT